MARNRTRAKTAAKSKPPFPLLLALGGGVLLLVAALAINLGRKPAGAPVEVRGAPSLEADRQRVDLGDVKLGEWVTVEFELTNVGDQALEFTQKPYVQVVEGC